LQLCACLLARLLKSEIACIAVCVYMLDRPI